MVKAATDEQMKKVHALRKQCKMSSLSRTFLLSEREADLQIKMCSALIVIKREEEREVVKRESENG